MAVIAGQEMAITNQAMATASETTDLVMADTGDLSTTDFEICQKLTKNPPSMATATDTTTLADTGDLSTTEICQKLKTTKLGSNKMSVRFLMHCCCLP